MSGELGPAPGDGTGREVLAALESVRRRLLDLTLRNRLLNYRPSKLRGITIVDEDPRQILRRLVTDGRPMSFQGRPDPKGDSTAEDAPPPALAPDTTDDRLNTPYAVTPLEDRLLRTWADARTVLEEQGVNTLFLAIGMVTWSEASDSAKTYRAPVLLVPASLERGERGRFRIRWSGEDLGGNLSLAVKVKQDFGIDWPALAEDEDVDLDSLFGAVERAMRGRTGWSLDRSALAVDFFSFAKYLMFRDLDPAAWPEGKRPHQHAIVSGLLSGGLLPDGPPQPEPAEIDPIRPPESAFEVCDADSSQTVVLLDVASGRNLVVEGPPGTGKSQTIANVVAEAVAAGKRVLFVAEKMAALEVVKRRLDEYRIGDACLELHSHKTRKKELLRELGRTLELPRLALSGDGEHMARLLETRQRLNAYARELHRPVGPHGWTPFQAQAELARILTSEEPLPRGQFEELASCTRQDFDDRRRAVRNLQSKIREIGVPSEHPFYDCHPEQLLPSDVPEVTRELVTAAAALDALNAAVQQLGSRLGVPISATLAEIARSVRAADLLTTMPLGVLDVAASDVRWKDQFKVIEAALRAGARSRELREEFAATLSDGAWGEDVSQLRLDLERSGPSWTRVFHPGFHRARKRLRSLCRGEIPSTHPDRVAMTDAIGEEADCSRLRCKSDPLLTELTGRSWKGTSSNFESLLAVATWLSGFQGALERGELPADAFQCLESGRVKDGLAPAAQAVRAQLQVLEAALGVVADRLRPASACWRAGQSSTPSPDLGAVDTTRTGDWLAACRADPRRVLEIEAYNRVRKQCTDLGLTSLCDTADHWREAGHALEDALLQTWCEGVIRAAMRERPILADFERSSHENLIAEFRKLDSEMILVNRERVRCRHRDGLPFPNAPGATGVLREQINLNKRHRPIRWLMKECAGPIQALKPVFMMSPLSIAMFLPPDGPRFDVVIFDEASQVRPQDSIGAFLRAGQVVVVGDSHQLPPTSFFDNTMSDGDEDDEAPDPHVDAGEMESILSLMRARGAQVRSLQWHYRSRHGGLIRVSGHEFYRDLQIFPSPEETAANVGLRLHHLPHTKYGRGGSRTNVEEAKAVAAAVLEHANSYPHLTLGVAAFSSSQQMAILRQLDLLRREHRELEAFEAAHPHEPLFVKNLENVQGDERDVILISVGYGRDERGQMTLNFGPVNQDGGERRLNVLISRARQRCEVFSNFTGDDLALQANSPRGVRLLKTYLKFAETGELDVPTFSGREPQSPFEVSVLDFLREEGHTAHPQVGSAGYFIDIGLVDPDLPGRYMLGVECDGAKYHSARSARDRDRLREQVLRIKGWTIHRIWSTSWFQENDRERRRLLLAIEAARDGHHASGPVVPSIVSSMPPAPLIRTVEAPTTAATSLTVPYLSVSLTVSTRGLQLHEVEVAAMSDWIGQVVDVESPVHFEEVLRRIREAVGVYRAGGRIRERFDDALKYCVSSGRVSQRGDFLWLPGMKAPPLRDRAALPLGSRRLEFVAPEEIHALALAVVRRSFSIGRDELAIELSRLLGFARLGEDMRVRLGTEISALEQAGFMVTRQGRFHSQGE